MLSTAPRVPWSARCERSTSARGDSPACRSSAVTAARAAAAASAPCPRPSATARSTPLAIGLTRCTSPHCASPGRVRIATPHSITRAVPGEVSRILAPPFLHGDGRALPDPRAHVEIVHEAPRTRQAEAQTARRRVAVLERALHVADPGPLIARHDHDAAAVAVGHQAERDLPPLGVHEDVAGDFGNRGSDDRLVATR